MSAQLAVADLASQSRRGEKSYRTVPSEDRSGLYEVTVTPRIAAALYLPGGLSNDIAEATADVCAFDQFCSAEIASLSSVLLRSESVASSQIEGLLVSARVLAEAEIGETHRQQAKLIAANVAAMNAAIDLSGRLDAAAILAMHKVLMGQEVPQIAGRWREEQVWIGGSSFGLHGADYIAAVHDRVPEAIDDLVIFMRRSDVPALARAAIAHAHFESIHPFPDGNGRTGRALMSALLRSRGVREHIIVPISSGLLAHQDDYFAALVAYLRGQVEPITARSDSGVHQLADYLMRQLVVTSVMVRSALNVSGVGAQRYL
ncbi:Fic family protein [Dermatophilus congolensis]|uniref:Fic family protein n=1 Tax=Dermatophilus congolensis TaxID=1863 RepID=UPI001AAF89E0|nr:Fic family protein [Dermatophilus congolensis]